MFKDTKILVAIYNRSKEYNGNAVTSYTRSIYSIGVWVEVKVCLLIENIDYIDGRVGSNGTCGSLN